MKTEPFKALALVQLIGAVFAHPAPATTTTAVTLPRGGWLSGNGASERYSESLEQQVLQLDRQLRQARDEVAQLRARRKYSKPVVVGNKSDGDDTSDLEGKVRTLTQQIDELESAKSDLDGALTTSKLKIEELEQMIAEEQEGSQQLREKFEQDLQALQSSTYEKSERNISDLTTLMEEQVAQAASDARLEVDQEMSSNIEQIKKELESSHQEELEAERKRSMEAVDAEKKKMRMLVKALAMREKKLAEQ
jgi:chromosome segregation ATPase